MKSVCTAVYFIGNQIIENYIVFLNKISAGPLFELNCCAAELHLPYAKDKKQDHPGCRVNRICGGGKIVGKNRR
jgi:hypothetical protein